MAVGGRPGHRLASSVGGPSDPAHARVWEALETEPADRKRLLGHFVEDAIRTFDGYEVAVALRLGPGPPLCALRLVLSPCIERRRH